MRASGFETSARQMFSTAVITHPSFEDHICGHGHPESPARLQKLREQLRFKIKEHFDADELDSNSLLWLDSDDDAPLATKAQLVSAGHSQSYIHTMFELFEEAHSRQISLPIDGDTVVSPGTGQAALRAAGAAISAVDLVLDNGPEKEHINSVFCAVRPPGHHAERRRAMGFCFFGNVAAGIARARDKHGVRRVAILDFDVHHGNGTQDLLSEDQDSLFVSIHESPLFPGTGSVSETGNSDKVLNIPLAAGTHGDMVFSLVESVIIPKLKDWDPELLFFSAGFDAHIDDPLANFKLTSTDFSRITRAVLQATVADERSSTKGCVSCLEGGYNLPALIESVTTHVATLMRH